MKTLRDMCLDTSRWDRSVAGQDPSAIDLFLLLLFRGFLGDLPFHTKPKQNGAFQHCYLNLLVVEFE